MNWDDLRFFLAVCREGSVKRAGEALGVSHTTVLRRIGAFEEALGTRFFDRTHGGYAMAQAAEDLFEHAVRMEAEVLALSRKVYGRESELRGTVRITATLEVASGLIAAELPRFRASFPEIELELFETMSTLDLDAHEADIALRLTNNPPEFLIGRKVQPLTQAIYGSASYLEEHGDKPDVILYRVDGETSEWVNMYFPGARIALRTDSPTTMLSAVKAGLGIAALPCYQADQEPTLRRLHHPLPSLLDWGFWILTHPDFRSTPRVRVCREFLTTILEEKRALIVGETSRFWDQDVSAS